MIHELVKTKLENFYKRGAVGDRISALLCFFDIVQIVCVAENIEIKNSERINSYFNYLYGYAVKKALSQTIQHFQQGKKQTLNINQFIIEKRPKKSSFNKIFKQYYNSNSNVKEIKNFIENFMQEFEPILNSYLNKEKPEEKKISESLRGGIGFLSCEL